MSRSSMFLFGAICIAIGVGGYWIYQDQQRRSGVELSVGGRSVTIETR